MKRIVVALVFGLSGIVSGQVPLPAALVTAKTATLVNGGVDQKFFDVITEEITAWHRYALVEKDGDLTLTIEPEASFVQNPVTGLTTPVKLMHLVIRQDDRVLYRDKINQGCCKLKSLVQKTLERLDKRLNGK